METVRSLQRDADVNLDNCENEPIHIPGAIQPHGTLIVCRERDLTVTQVAANVIDHLGKTPAAILGKSVTGLFDAESASILASASHEATLRSLNPLRLTTEDGRAFEAVLHRPPHPPGVLVIELEPTSVDYSKNGPSFDPRLRGAIHRLQASVDTTSLTRIAAEEVRALTGFDRVMIYRFDADWNGSVVAEAKNAALDSLLGQHYPASDIPAQARRLYELNWLRLIADASYVASPMQGAADGQLDSAADPNAPLDMSFAVLRSVSPIHVEYLKNMGVTASMSVSLVMDGKLTGLIACHHYAGPLRVPFAIRETCEYLGQALSWHDNVLSTAALADAMRKVQENEAEVVRRAATAGELLDGLAIEPLMALANAGGAAVVLTDGTRSIGVTPTNAQIATLVQHLQTVERDVVVTDKLSELIAGASNWTDQAAGLLAVAISRELGEYLLWFRPSSERVIDWAGNPNHVKLTQADGATPRLSPRGSFALWREIVQGRSLPWNSWEIEGASSLRRLLLGGIRRRANELRTLNARLVEADRAKDNFIATVSHELRTPLNAINGWAHLLRKGGVPQEKINHALDVIARNAQMQSQLIEDLLDVSRMASGKLTLDVEKVNLPDIIESTIESVSLAAEARNLRITAVLDPRASPVLGDPIRLRQIVSNLLNNAIKFTPKGGSIRIGLQRRESDVELSVKDSGQGIDAAFLPFVFEAFRQEDAEMNRRSQGLGLGLAIVKKLVELHGGRASVLSEGLGRGSTFFVRLPMSSVSATPELEPPPVSQHLDSPNELAGLRVLVVEDEPDSRDLLQHVLERCGAIVTTAADAKSALAQLDKCANDLDVIVSDIGLPETDGLALMRRVRERAANAGGRLPSVALTAYTRAIDRTRSLQAGFSAHVPKPVDPNELVAVLVSLVRR